MSSVTYGISRDFWQALATIKVSRREIDLLIWRTKCTNGTASLIYVRFAPFLDHYDLMATTEPPVK